MRPGTGCVSPALESGEAGATLEGKGDRDGRGPGAPFSLARLADAFMAAQMRRAEREMAAFLERHDAKLLAARQHLLFNLAAQPRR
jgi:hypothetical protein